MSAQVSNSALREKNKNAIEVKVALIGLNRITASLGLALRDFSNRPNAPVVFHVLGRDTNKEAMKTAHKNNMIDDYHINLKEALGNADIVFVSCTMAEQPALYEQMGPLLKSGAVVIDLAPFKQPAVKLAEKHFLRDADGDPKAHLVGITPLVGFEAVYIPNNDLESAAPLLFHHSDVLVAPHAKASQEAVKVVSDLADFLEMTPRFTDPAEHDALMALTEGIPPLLSLLLVQTILQSPSKSDFWRATNPAFGAAVHGLHNQNTHDLLAFWTPIKDSLIRHIDQLMTSLQTIRGYLAQPDTGLLKSYIDQMLDGFTEWEIRRRDNKWDDPALEQTAVAVSTGFVTRMFMGGRKKQEDE